MTPAEAARWLVYQMSYADCGSVGKGNDRNKAKKEKGIDDEGKPAPAPTSQSVAPSLKTAPKVKRGVILS